MPRLGSAGASSNRVPISNLLLVGVVVGRVASSCGVAHFPKRFCPWLLELLIDLVSRR